MHSRHEKDKEWTIGEILREMSAPKFPHFVIRAIEQVQNWMSDLLYEEKGYLAQDISSMMDGVVAGDPEKLLRDLEWVESFADIVPGTSQPSGHKDMIVLCMGPADFDDGMRIAVDYSSLFARGVCKRVWILCDNWIIGDVVRYLQHIRALNREGVSFHFILVTPWGWSEIPISSEPVPGRKLDWKNNNRKGYTSRPNTSHEDESGSGNR